MPHDDARWYAVLDDIEAHLVVQRAAVDAGAWRAITAFILPPGLGTLPAHLRTRLSRLAHESEQLEIVVKQMHETLGARLAALPPRRPARAVPDVPHYLDFTS